MANLFKSKFGGLLRKVLNYFEGDGQPRPTVAPTPVPPPKRAPAPTPAPTPKRGSTPAPANTPKRGSAPQPPPAAARPASSPAAIAGKPASVPPQNVAGKESAAASGTQVQEIELPLAAIIAALPTELRGRVIATPAEGMTIRLSVETVVTQLAFGAVKITFGELRQLAPGIFANTGGEHDMRPVNLPLSELLKRVNPALFSRRTAQKVQTVSDEIAGPFAERGQGIKFTTQPLKPAPTPPSPPPAAPEPEPAKPIAFAPPPPRQVVPTPPPAAPMPKPSTPVPSAPSAPLPPSIRMAGTAGSKPTDSPAKVDNGHVAPPALKLATPPVPAPAPVSTSVPPPPSAPSVPVPGAEPGQLMIVVKLSDLLEKWPDNLKDEIMTSSFAGLSVTLEGSMVEPGLKRGRVAMTWKQIRLLIAPNSAASSNDQIELELPLKVVAPLFMAAQKNTGRIQSKASVGADIPDLFYGFPKPATPAAVAAPTPPPVVPAAPAAPVLPVPPPAPVVPAMQMAPTMPPAPPPTALPLPASVPLPPVAQVAQAAQKAADTNFYSRVDNNESGTTDFTTRQLQPREVVARAMKLPGMAGVVLALPDGLCVASQVPPDLNSDALAGFLPQIFERVNQSTRELRMGALNNVNFTVGNVPWKIFRVNAIYFAAFGRPGESLPSAELAQLAAELDRKKFKTEN